MKAMGHKDVDGVTDGRGTGCSGEKKERTDNEEKTWVDKERADIGKADTVCNGTLGKG